MADTENERFGALCCQHGHIPQLWRGEIIRWLENVSGRGWALLTNRKRQTVWQVLSGTYERASSWCGIWEPLQTQREALISWRAISGEKSPQHNERLYGEAAAQAWRFQPDKTLPSEPDNADVAAVRCSCFVTLKTCLRVHFLTRLKSL